MKASQLPNNTCSDKATELASRADYIDAMSRLANSVNVVTSNGAGGQIGVTVSAATSVSAEPPTLLVCIHELSKAIPAIQENGVFCLNVLDSTQQHIAEIFAGMSSEKPEDSFASEHWVSLKTACPSLKEGLAVFDCKVNAVHKEGTHYIFIGQVLAAIKGKGAPLVYSQRAYAKPDWGDAKPSD